MGSVPSTVYYFGWRRWRVLFLLLLKLHKQPTKASLISRFATLINFWIINWRVEIGFQGWKLREIIWDLCCLMCWDHHFLGFHISCHWLGEATWLFFFFFKDPIAPPPLQCLFFFLHAWLPLIGYLHLANFTLSFSSRPFTGKRDWKKEKF